MSDLPIVFIHKGYSSYMEFTLRQARYTNPESEILLLGDPANNRFDFVTHIHFEQFANLATAFKKYYCHMSTNTYAYELFCIQRWFYLLEFVRHAKLDRFFYCDTDVMVYTDLHAYFHGLGKVGQDGILAFAESNRASASNALWQVSTLEQFCDFIYQGYQSKKAITQARDYLERHVRNLGGISDMYWVEQFFKTRLDTVFCINEVHENKTLDSNINTSRGYFLNEYQINRQGHKKIIWRKNKPYVYNLKLAKEIEFGLLHFSGSTKYKIPRCYTGEAFPNDTKLKLMALFLDMIAMVYALLKLNRITFFRHWASEI